jgi:hypothetical protein
MATSYFRGSATIAILIAVLALSAATTPARAQSRRAFRVTTLGLADPPIFTAFGAAPCAGPLNTVVNGLINQSLTACKDDVADPCVLEFNIVAVFDPLVQTAGANPAGIVPCTSNGSPCGLDFAVLDECTRTGGTAGPVTCTSDSSAVLSTTYSNGGSSATCLAGLPGTFGPNNNGVNASLVATTGNSTNNCGVSGLIELTLRLGDGLITIPLKGAQLAARYNGNPATGLTTGLARGFLSEADADQIIINVEFGSTMLNAPLSQLLPGGTGNCRTAATGQDDRDRNPPGSLDGERGWWFYLTFAAAQQITVPEFPTPTATETMAPADTPTPTPPPPTDTPVPTNTAVPTNTPMTASCPGDCNGDGRVPINEVQLAANVYLDTATFSACPAADRNGSSSVEINEVVLAARSFQFDCPVP